MAYKTPGVYTVEENAFPNAVVEVATAIPAFVGYTEKALNNADALSYKPWRIRSLSEYVQFYGGGPDSRFLLARSDEAGYRLTLNDNPYSLYACMQLFFQNGGAACYIVSVGDYTQDISAALLTNGVMQLRAAQEPTLVVVPEAVMLADEAECIAVQQAMLEHCGVEMGNRFAILDIHRGYLDRASAPDPIKQFRDHLGNNCLSFGAAYYPWIDTTVVSEKDLSYRNIDPSSTPLLLEMLEADMNLHAAPAGSVAQQNRDDNAEALALIADRWLVARQTDGKYALLTASEFGPAQSVADKRAFKYFDEMISLFSAEQLDEARQMVASARLALHQRLSASSSLYKHMLCAMALELNRLPPSAAIAGVYTAVDKLRGVWKAPANVSLKGVRAPSVKMSQDQLDELNVTSDGKAVNALRPFIGPEVMVWAAHTLDGNSPDWRHVNVRRTVIMLEQSLRAVIAAYALAPNTPATWATLEAMTSAFLKGIWKRGGLAGASAEDAVAVKIGTPETMTGEDILAGRMKMRVAVALTHPAEFITIAFEQQMQMP